MLKALRLENAPAPLKVRPGSDPEPADPTFAALMAQASMTAMPPPPHEHQSQIQAERSTSVREAKEEPAAEKEPMAAESNPPAESSPDIKTNPEATGSEAGSAVASPGTLQSQTSIGVEGTPGAPVPTPIPVQAPTTATAHQPPQSIEGTKDQSLKAPQPPAHALAPESPAVKSETQSHSTKPQETTVMEVSPEETAASSSEPLESLPPAKPSLRQNTDAKEKPLQEMETRAAAPSQNTAAPGSGEVKVPLPLEKTLREEGSPVAAQPAPNHKPPLQVIDTSSHFHAEGIKASSSTLEPPVLVRPSPVFAQVEGSVRWILQNRVQGAELQLHPESLGRVTIQLRVEGQEVHAKIWATETTSVAVLQDHKAFLESSLKEQGLNLGSFDLHSGTRGDEARTAHHERSLPPIPLAEILQEMPSSSGISTEEPHQIEVYA